ncbi:MAG: hypothetical protein ACREU7_16805, partial [Burkholderiales bacterium]
MYPSTLPANVGPSCAAGTMAVARHRAPASGHTRGWPALKLERHDTAPGSKALPAGAEQHLVFFSPGRGHVELERGGESIRRELNLGSVA